MEKIQKNRRKNKKYSAEFKICVIIDMCENHLSYSETARKHQIGTGKDNGGALCTLHRWERIYLEEGVEGLMKDNRGKACATGKRKGRPPKRKPLDEMSQEELID